MLPSYLQTRIFQDLYNSGARKFCIYGMAPPGCLPELKTLHGKPELDGCVDEVNKEALGYNMKLKVAISSLISQVPDIKVVLISTNPSWI
jgi:hypothetical protein